MDTLNTVLRRNAGMKKIRLLVLSVLCASLMLFSGCGGGGGGGNTAANPPTVPPIVAPTAFINVFPQTISPGQSATLTWLTTNATSAEISETPAKTLSAKYEFHSDNEPIIITSKTPEGITVQHREVSSVHSSGYAVPLNGSMVVSPTVTTTYTLTAKGSGGTVDAKITLQVTATPPTPPEPQQPTASINVSPQTITVGQSATLSWQTANAETTTLNGQSVALSGSMMVSPPATTSYTLVATGQGGTAQAQVTLQVNSQPSADELVKTYNIHPIPGNNGKTMRWLNGYVDVYDATGYVNLQNALDEWNGAIGGPIVLRKSTNPASPITIGTDANITGCGLATYSIATGTGGDNRIYLGIITINPSCASNYGVYLHELGHVIGFFGHTNDGGAMDAFIGSGLTGTVRTTIHRLYQLPVGTYIP